MKKNLKNSLKNFRSKSQNSFRKMRTRSQNSLQKMRSRSVYFTNPLEKKHREFFADVWENDLRNTIPSVNIREENNYYTIEMAVPGLKKEDIYIKIEGNHLIVGCVAENKKAHENNGYLRREFNYSRFSRSLAITQSMDASQLSTAYDDGILCISIPKKDK